MPASWLDYAEELGEAAETLWANSGNVLVIEDNTQLNGLLTKKRSTAHSRSYILLASLALENVLKGLIIARNAKLISSGYLDKALQSHKLLDLVKRVDNLLLSKDERQILQVCQEAIPYWGRYPIPLKYKGLKPIEAANDKFHTSFRGLHFRLCKMLYETIKDGWDSGVGAKTLQLRNACYGDMINIKDKLLLANENKRLHRAG